MVTFALYFVAGLILDVVTVAYYMAVQSKSVLWSGFWSFSMTIVSYGIFYNIITSPDVWQNLFAFAFGGAVGAAITVALRKKDKIRI